MLENNRFESEKYLLETLKRIAKNKSDYKVLYVNVSKLKPKNRHPRFVKIISRMFDDLVAVSDGSMFVLSNGDFAILGANLNPKNVFDAVDKLRHGLVTDPIWTSVNAENFTEVYTSDDFDALTDRIENIMADSRNLRRPDYKYPVEAEQINAVKEHLNEINLVDLIKHQSVLKLNGPNSFELMFQEFFVAVKDLSKKFDAGIDLTGNKWLFLYLTQTLDKKTMYSFTFSEIVNKPRKISLNLNLSTIFSHEFEEFISRIETEGQKLVAEVQAMDILNNLPLFLDAKELLHKKGHQILIDAASIELLQMLNTKTLDVDYIKIFWHALMNEYDNQNSGVKTLLENVGLEKLILAKCLDANALRWGIKNGIRAFQGPYIDAVEVALIRKVCPDAAACPLDDCLKRKRLIAGDFRNRCRYKQFLEKEPE